MREYNPVFLSTDFPDPHYDPTYAETADRMAIREAVRALARVVLLRTELVYRGVVGVDHLIDAVAGGLNWAKEDTSGVDYPSRVGRIYSGSARGILHQRLARGSFTAGVFIGGMERTEEEFELFHAENPEARLFPVASTGGAAEKLLDQVEEGILNEGERAMLREDLVYGALFDRLLWRGAPESKRTLARKFPRDTVGSW